MERRYVEAIQQRLGMTRSRRQVLGTAAGGALGGIGATLVGRSLSGLLDAGQVSAARAQGATISIKDFQFEPPTLEVPVGTEVTWTNDGGAPHTATAFDGAFDSGVLTTGQTFTHLFSTAGDYGYVCVIHGEPMSGTITVLAGTPTPTKVHVRPNVHHLDPGGPELTAYATAVAEMKRRPETDPTSWMYQAFIHQIPPADFNRILGAAGLQTWDDVAVYFSDRGWYTCEHHSPNFWPWHRSYLYWFERIVRELGGYPDFALPYWDYSNPAERTLPAPFRDPNSPLFVAERDPDLNNGSQPALTPAQQFRIFDNICLGFGQDDFLDASDGLEITPHDAVHGWVGGDFQPPPTPPQPPRQPGLMSSPRTAAQDPIFYLHHANMDRLWSSWLAVPGNLNLMDSAWLDDDENITTGLPIVTVYNFFDEQGTRVTARRTAREVLDTRVDLGYEYGSLFTGADAMCPAVDTISASPQAVFATPAATPVAPAELGANAPPEGIAIGADPVTVPVAVAAPQDALGALTRGDDVILTLEGVRGTGVFGAVFEVYVNLPAGEQPDVHGPYFVGHISLFGRQPTDRELPASLPEVHDDHMADHMGRQQFNISRNVAALQAMDEWTGEVAVTIVPYGESAALATNGATPAAAGTPAALLTDTWVTLDGISIGTR